MELKQYKPFVHVVVPHRHEVEFAIIPFMFKQAPILLQILLKHYKPVVVVHVVLPHSQVEVFIYKPVF